MLNLRDPDNRIGQTASSSRSRVPEVLTSGFVAGLEHDDVWDDEQLSS